jgi:hypothetical protein
VYKCSSRCRSCFRQKLGHNLAALHEAAFRPSHARTPHRSERFRRFGSGSEQPFIVERIHHNVGA